VLENQEVLLLVNRMQQTAETLKDSPSLAIRAPEKQSEHEKLNYTERSGREGTHVFEGLELRAPLDECKYRYVFQSSLDGELYM
jgi:hypothetical protein